MEIAKYVKTPFRGSVLNQLFGAAIETYLNFHFHFSLTTTCFAGKLSQRVFQFLSLLVSLSSQDRQTEHGKFINCKLSVTDSVGCT